MSRKHKSNFIATDEHRVLVEQMSAAGISHEQQAMVLNISTDTLVRHFDRELKVGRVSANMKMAGALFQNGMEGNVVAQIFWLKTRAGWKDQAFVDEEGSAPVLVFNRGDDRPSVKRLNEPSSDTEAA